jgi:hypothetical protein
MPDTRHGLATTHRHNLLVQRELRAIKRTVARIEASFEGVPSLLARVLRTAARRAGHRVR